ncbi:MAG: ABC transporter substrate-binding protein [Chloroflexi bacterium]|nr:ABC transporter substrate-binding protein [Chloroflexota bacterium]
MTLTDDVGSTLTLDEEPSKIISLSPANTETVFALGAGDRLVGGTDADDYPAEAKALPDVATFQGVQVEKVLALGADLVLAAGNDFTPPADIQRLRDLGIPVVVLYAETVDEVLADIELIGRSVGAADEAAAMTASMRHRMDTISAAAQVGPAPRVFYQIGSEPDIYGPADDSFVADLIELAGGQPITTGDAVSFTMPLERLVEADPEVIVVGDANYGVTPADVKARGGAWSSMSAVKKDQVRPVDDIIVTRPGPRLADGLAALALAIDPGSAVPTASPSASAVAP